MVSRTIREADQIGLLLVSEADPEPLQCDAITWPKDSLGARLVAMTKNPTS